MHFEFAYNVFIIQKYKQLVMYYKCNTKCPIIANLIIVFILFVFIDNIVIINVWFITYVKSRKPNKKYVI